MESREDTIFDEDATPGKGTLAQINFALTDNGRWLLKVIAGPNNGAEFPMQTSSSYIIGTDPNTCDIVFHDTSVSRQHARISVGSDDRLSIEDLKSRNGTLLDGEPIKGKKPMATNSLVSMGTTSFIVFDREGEMKTIISPLLPSIVKVLQKEDSKKEEATAKASSRTDDGIKEMDTRPAPKKHSEGKFGAYVLIAILTGLFAIIGIGTAQLFKSEPVVVQSTVDPTKTLNDALAAFPSVKYSFNKSTGKLLLVGHVLTSTDKNGLLYNLQGMNFIKDIDDTGVVIDEFVWQEINQLLSRNPNWKSINIQAATPGHFVITGYLQTRKQAEQLNEYLSANFPYLDLLEKRVLVDEDVISGVSLQLQNIGVKDVNAQLSNGELTLMGTIPKNKVSDLQGLVMELKKIPGVRNVKNFVTELAPEASMINVSDRYQVTGFSQGSNTVSVVINGRILSKGDILDGMIITSIKPNTILLEKDGVKYRIDYSR